MKKIILPCIISFIIMTITNCSFATTATVNVTAVRIRETASTDSNIITNIYEEDEVEILEEAGEWYKVKYGESVGYAKAEFFTKKNETINNTVSNTTENTVENTTEQTSVVDDTQAQPTSDVVPNEQDVTAIQEPMVGDIITLQSSVKIRVIPSLSALAKTEIMQGSTVTVEAKLGNWYKILSESSSGWITKSKLVISQTSVQQTEEQPKPSVQPETQTPENTTSTENVVPEQTVEQTQTTQTQAEQTSANNKTAIVIVETARVRSSASANSDIIDVLDEDDIVTITGEEGEFYKITSDKIGSGYISKTLVKVKDVTARSSAEERENTVSAESNQAVNQLLQEAATTSVTGNDIVAFAKQYLGYPYVLGCSTPENGFDCSGFTRYIFGHFGYALGQVAAEQTSLGEVVERENLQTGDLILFYNDGKTKIGHCGIYCGDGNFIHSANPQRGVVIDNLNTNSYYNQRFVTARRIV